MNLRQLEYFISVADTLNFTRAAEKCFISQTAMTQQIRALEETVGVPLFLRDKHHVELTPAGQVYLNEARAILARSDEAIKLARTAARGLTGKLTIGFIRGYEQSLFSENLRGFHEAYPNLSIELVRENLSALYELVKDGKCDVVFNLSSYFQTYPELEHYFLKAYPLMVVLYPGHPLAGESRLTYRDLANEEFIIMQPKARPNDEAEEVMLCYHRGGFMPKIVSREREVQTLLLMVSAAMGVAIMPEYTVRYYRNAKNLRIVPLMKPDQTPETLDFEIAWRTGNTNPAIEELLQWIRSHGFTE